MTKADIEQFVDWGGVTIMVDPIRNDQWIYDGAGDRHKASQSRGMMEDYKSMMRANGWQDAHHDTPQMYLPTTQDIDNIEKYTYRECGNEAAAGHDLIVPYRPGMESARRGGELGNGRLPVISGLMYSGALQNKSTGIIEHEIREAERYTNTRLFDRSGLCR
jgi:hypothetical protein